MSINSNRIENKSGVIGIYVFILSSVFLVTLFTLYPFQFQNFDRISRLHLYFDGLKFGGYHHCCTHLAYLEPLANVLLFTPFGFGVSGLLWSASGPWARRLGFVFLVSLGLSLCIEVLQVFQPHREPSLTDLLMNSTGGCLGYLSFRVTRAIRQKLRR